MVERRDCDRRGLGSKPTRAILLCPWKRHFMALSPAWWSWQAVLNYSHISIKLQADSNILASPEAGRGNCSLYLLTFLRIRRINRDKIKICPPYQLTRALPQNKRRGGQFGIGAEKPGELPKKVLL